MAEALTAVMCISGPLFFCVSVLLTIIHLIYIQHAKESEQTLTKRVTALEQLVEVLNQDALQVSRNKWLKDIKKISYRNEIEVEVKFIHPLLRFLGYDSNDFEIRVPVKVQVGRQNSRGQADWVIWGTAPTSQRQAIAVIEAKEAGQQLDAIVQEQARSYAFGLNAPIYVLTNGRELQVFRRGIQKDTCVLDCDVSDLRSSWKMVEKELGAIACLGCSQRSSGME